MSDQLVLEEEPVALDVSPYWAQRAAEFHAKNPDVYDKLVYYARQAKSYGRRRIGIELLWNRMRWDYMVTTDHGSDFKMNQNFKAWYARLIMERESDLKGIFETRSRR